LFCLFFTLTDMYYRKKKTFFHKRHAIGAPIK